MALRNLPGGAMQGTPTPCLGKALAPNALTTLQLAKISNRLGSLEPQRLRLGTNFKAANCAGRLGIVEWFGVRCDDVDCLSPQVVEKQLSHERSVVDIKPFRRRDEDTSIAMLG